MISSTAIATPATRIASAPILKRSKSATRPFNRSRLPILKGSASSVAWALRIRSNTILKLESFAEDMQHDYPLVPYAQRGRFVLALADLLHELAAKQVDADWWINNRQRIRQTKEFYNMASPAALKDELVGEVDLFNQISRAYEIGDSEPGCAVVVASDADIDAAVDKPAASVYEESRIGGVVCGRLVGQTGWITLD